MPGAPARVAGTTETEAINGRNSAGRAAPSKLSSAVGFPADISDPSTGSGRHPQVGASTTEDAAWQRGDWGADFTLYTEAERQQQFQQLQESTIDRRKSGDLMGSSEYVEVLRGIFDSSSMHQRATQTRFTQPPRTSVSGSADPVSVAVRFLSVQRMGVASLF